MRTPVLTETIEKTPVLDDDQPIVVEHPAKSIVPPPLDEDGHRECAREGCASRFVPLSRAQAEGGHLEVTEFYCSVECAVVAFYKRHDMRLKPETLQIATRNSARNVDTQARTAKRAERDARYGPVREISEVVETRGPRVVVRLEVCGHTRVTKTGRKRMRCRPCLKATKDARVPASSESTDVKKSKPESKRPRAKKQERRQQKSRERKPTRRGKKSRRTRT